MQKIALIGTFIRDRIIPLSGPEVQCVGGLYHSLAFASLLAGEKAQIMPIARVGHDYFPTIQQSLAGFDNIDLSHIVLDRQKNTAVTLRYKTLTSRDEITTAPMRPLEKSELHGLRHVHGILVNMITGVDISFDALQWLSEQSPAMLYLDFHSLALGIDAQGKRYYRKPKNWQAWLQVVDFVQMNEDEAACLCGKKGIKTFIQFLKELLDETNLSGAFVTLGENGALAGTKNMHGNTEIKHISAMADNIVIRDIIGCGDAYGAGFFIHYLAKQDFWQAAEFANRVAARNATYMGSITKELFERDIKPYENIET
ncbi:MAG: carbohydrate kinase family protein [bacterium]